MRLIVFLFFLTVACNLSSRGQILFDDQFEHANLDSASYDSTSASWSIAPDIFLHFRIFGAAGLTPDFRIWDKDGYRLRNDHRMVYSYDNDSTWFFFDNGSKTGSQAYYYFSNDSAFTADTVYIAYWFPWSFFQQIRYMQAIHGHKNVVNDSAWAMSVEGREIFAFQITDTSYDNCFKQHIVWTGLQHPSEFKQSYITNGLSDFLIYDQSALSDTLRKYFVFTIFPMLNPDGVFHGYGTNAQGQDLNRSWSPDTVAGGNFEIDQVKKLVWTLTSGQVDYSIDIHSNPGHQGLYYYFGLKSAPAPDSLLAETLVDQIHYFDSLDNSGNVLVMDNILFDTYGGIAFTAGNWFNQSMGAISYTFEPGSVPPVSIERLNNLGASMAKGFYNIRGSSKVSGVITTDSTTLISITIQSGKPPFAIVWNHDSLLINDTISITGNGYYHVSVTDQNGCVFEDSLFVTATTVMESDLAQTSLIYPNPSEGFVIVSRNKSQILESIEIISTNGERILYSDCNSKYTAGLDLGFLSNGIYLVRINYADQTKIEKLVILRY